ncbi:MAG: hypothetical protein AAGJ53_06995, partial [Pseudomonadota bacterium]
MRPETTSERLDRLLRRKRRLTAASWAAGLTAAAGVAAVFLVDPEPVGVYRGTLDGFQQQPSDDEVQTRLIVDLEDGRKIRSVPRPGDAALQPGAALCFLRTRNPILGYVRHVR